MQIIVKLTKDEYKQMLTEVPDLPSTCKGVRIFNPVIDPGYYTLKTFIKKFGPKKKKKVAKK